MASASDPNGYGTSIAYFNMRPDMGLVSGVDCVVDALLVRLSTTRLWYEPGYGFNVGNLVNSSVDPNAAVASIQKEILKDDRVQSAVANYSFDGTTLLVYVAVTLTGAETFTLIGQASSLSASSFQFSVSQAT